MFGLVAKKPSPISRCRYAHDRGQFAQTDIPDGTALPRRPTVGANLGGLHR